jgi:hypothetical protein
MSQFAISQRNIQSVASPTFDNIAEKYVSPTLIKMAPGIFNLSINLYNTYRGTKEIIIGRVQSITKQDISKKPLASRVTSYCTKFFTEIKESIAQCKFYAIHGLFYLGSGISGSVAALHELGAIHIGKAFSALKLAESSLFIFASLLGLEHYINIYEGAKAPLNATKEQLDAVHRTKASAVLGIITCISYIISCSVALLTGAALLAFLLSCLGSLTEGLKTLYDFFYKTST